MSQSTHLLGLVGEVHRGERGSWTFTWDPYPVLPKGGVHTQGTQAGDWCQEENQRPKLGICHMYAIPALWAMVRRCVPSVMPAWTAQGRLSFKIQAKDRPVDSVGKDACCLKLNYMNSVPSTHTIGGEDWLLQVGVCSSQELCDTCVSMHMHTHIENKIVNKEQGVEDRRVGKWKENEMEMELQGGSLSQGRKPGSRLCL